jgi:hypothetical protein
MDLIKRTVRLLMYLVFALSCCNINNLFAATYYVSPSGSTSWPNCTTAGSPCRADSSNNAFLGAVAGDTVNFLPGTYTPRTPTNYEDIAWNPSNSGTSGNPITFKCQTAGTCTVIPHVNGPTIGASGRSWIVWDGFTGTRVAAHAIVNFRAGASNCTAQNMDITGYNWPTSISSGISLGTTSYITLRNNKIRNCTGNSWNSAGIMSYSSTNLLVENNEIYNCGSGIFDKVGGNTNTYRYNFIHDIADYGNQSGIRVMTENGQTASYIYIYQNVLLNAGIMAGASVDVLDHLYVYNNTLSGGYGIFHDEAGVTNYYEVFNNIVANSTQGIYARVQDTNTYFDYNDYYGNGIVGRLDSTTCSTIALLRTAFGGCPGTGNECNSVVTNPNFVNAGGTTAADYKRTSYPTNGRGGSYPSVMGAYITGNEVIGYMGPGGPNPPPNPPARLIIINQ